MCTHTRTRMQTERKQRAYSPCVCAHAQGCEWVHSRVNMNFSNTPIRVMCGVCVWASECGNVVYVATAWVGWVKVGVKKSKGVIVHRRKRSARNIPRPCPPTPSRQMTTAGPGTIVVLGGCIRSGRGTRKWTIVCASHTHTRANDLCTGPCEWQRAVGVLLTLWSGVRWDDGCDCIKDTSSMIGTIN